MVMRRPDYRMFYVLISILAGLVFPVAYADELHDAAMEGSKAKIEALLAQGVDVNARDSTGITPLHGAAFKGNKDIVELLLGRGADINAKEKYGATPLHSAAFLGNKDIVMLLLAKGADINARDEMGGTPLHFAVGGGRSGATNIAPKAELFYIPLDGSHRDIVKLLLAKGVDINARDATGLTPLQLAISKGNAGIAKLLLDKGADANAKNSAGVTPLQLAIQRGNADIAKLLLAKGADINAKNAAGKTPLQLAVSTGNSGMVTLLQTWGKVKYCPDQAVEFGVHDRALRDFDPGQGVTLDSTHSSTFNLSFGADSDRTRCIWVDK